MPRSRKKKRSNLWIVPAALLVLLAAFGLRRFLNRPMRSSLTAIKVSEAIRPSPVDIPGRLSTLKEKGFSVKPLDLGDDSSQNYLIYIPPEYPLVQANLAITQLVIPEKYRPARSLENRKKQRLDLVFISKDSLALNITVLKKRTSSDAVPGLPKIALVIYFWPPEKPSLSDQFIRSAVIKTFVIRGDHRLRDREAFSTVAMEPKGYPKNDPGPNTILVDDPSGKIKDKLNGACDAAGEPAGLYIWQGSRAVEDARIADILAGYCSRNQLIIIEPYPTAQSLIKKAALENSCIYAAPDLIIEPSASMNDIVKRLKGHLAKSKARSLILLPSTENTIKALAKIITKETTAKYEFVTVSGILQ